MLGKECQLLLIGPDRRADFVALVIQGGDGADFGHGGIIAKMTKLDFLIYVLVALIALCAPFVYEVYADVRLPWLFTSGPAFAGLFIAWWIIARRIKK